MNNAELFKTAPHNYSNSHLLNSFEDFEFCLVNFIHRSMQRKRLNNMSARHRIRDVLLNELKNLSKILLIFVEMHSLSVPKYLIVKQNIAFFMRCVWEKTP